MITNWLWDRKITESKAKKILKDPENDRFVPLAAVLLARTNEPKVIFKEYIDPVVFCHHWANIKRKMRKDKWNEPKIIFWQAIYETLIERLQEKGTIISIRKRRVVKNELYAETGKKIASFRKGQGLSQKDLAKKLGVSQQLISRIESGNENTSLATLSNIARALNKKVDIVLL